jgi:hypothetical protein
MNTQVGIVIAESGAAIISAERGGDDPSGGLVVGIERLPFSLDPVADRVNQLAAEAPRSVFVIDADGLGNALWRALSVARNRGEWRLYKDRGLERQRLVDALVVAMRFEEVHFAPDLESQDAMSKALVSYRRTIREDGELGSELVTALCLAIVRQPRRAQAFIA